jgi:Polysaccharide deacetylase
VTLLLRRLRGQAGLIRIGALLVPVSIVPLLAVTPVVRNEYRSFRSQFGPRKPLPAPKVTLTPAQLASWRPLPEYQGAVPVLLYHGIGDAHDRYTISRKQFAEQMAMLKHANFRTIGVAQYVRLLRGDPAGLPIRPILITFDGGRWNSYQGADAVLARYGFRAAIFPIASRVGNDRFYASWGELRRMRASGRWDVELEAGLGNANVRASADGGRAPFFANLAVSKKGGRESFAAFRQRVTSDVSRGMALMRAGLPGWQPQLVSLPFGDYGQLDSNDARISPFMRGWLLTRFSALALEGQPIFSTPGDREADRYQVTSATGTGQLYTWLRHGLSYSAWTPHERRAQVAVVSQPLRDRLNSRLSACAGIPRRSRAKVADCERGVAAARRDLRTALAELRLAARGVAPAAAAQKPRLPVDKRRLAANGGA